MDSSEELKNCPFCGGSPIMDTFTEPRGGDHVNICVISCENEVTCSAVVTEVLMSEEDIVKKKAIEKWQKRVS